MDTLTNLAFAAVFLTLICIGFAAARPKRNSEIEEWQEDYHRPSNDLRVTRVRSPYVISKGE